MPRHRRRPRVVVCSSPQLVDGYLPYVLHDGVERALGTVTFGEGDASIYLPPLGTAATQYDYGYEVIPAGQQSHTFTTNLQLSAAERPHVSIHDSGKCHVRTRAGPVSSLNAAALGPLHAFRGAHVGTLFSSDVGHLPPLGEVWPDPGARDARAELWDVTPPRGRAALRVAVYVSRNPLNPRPGAHESHSTQLRRSDGGVLFVSVEAFSDPKSLGADATVGVVGGWDPVGAPDVSKDAPFVYIRDRRTS